MKLLLRFLCLEVLPVHLLREVKPFIIWFCPHLLDYDVSMDEVVYLVVVIPTSPRSSKMEPGYKSYHHFRVVDSSKPDYLPKFGPDNPPPRISGGSLPVYGTDLWAGFFPILDPDNLGGGGKSTLT
jgi:hypothetical protein